MLKEKKFQYSSDLVKWVNDNINPMQVTSITPKGKHEGEGYILFYTK